MAAVPGLQRQQEVRSSQRLHRGIRGSEVREMRCERPDPLPPLLRNRKRGARARNDALSCRSRHRPSQSLAPSPAPCLRPRCYEKYIPHVKHVNEEVLEEPTDLPCISHDRPCRRCLGSNSLFFLFSLPLEFPFTVGDELWEALAEVRDENGAGHARSRARNTIRGRCKISTNKAYLMFCNVQLVYLSLRLPPPPPLSAPCDF